MFQRDSHLKAVQATALRLSVQYPDAQIQFYGIDSSPEILQGINALDISSKSLEQLSSCDYLICCLGGYLLNVVIAGFRDTHTKVISLFPGIVSHYQLDAFISRLNADAVWLNSKSDYLLYKEICKVFEVENNGICYGMAWLNLPTTSKTDQLRSSNVIRSVIFFEQIEILSNTKNQGLFSNLMLDLFQNHPNVNFLYKTRNHLASDFLENFRRQISLIHNVVVIDNLMDEQIDNADAYLSISSSALIEGLVMRKNVGLLDKRLLDKHAMEFYHGSNLFIKKNQMDFFAPNKTWQDQRITPPKQVIDLDCIKKNQSLVSLAKKRRLISIIFYILKLAVSHPKLIGLGFAKNSLVNIQKALEYLQNYNVFCKYKS